MTPPGCWLEDYLAGELQDAGREGGGSGDDTEARGAGAEAAGREGVVGLVEDVEGLGTEVEGDTVGTQGEVFVEAHIELIERIETDRVAACVAVWLIRGGQGEDGVGDRFTLKDRVLQYDDVLIAVELDALALGQDGVARRLIGALVENGADRLERVGRVGDVDRLAAAG